MSVKRVRQVEFQNSLDEISAAIRAVLQQARSFGRYRYTANLQITQTRFETTIRPWLYPLVLSTDMSIELWPMGTDVVVTLKIVTEWFIMADMFNFYNGYIDDFIGSLRAQLGASA